MSKQDPDSPSAKKNLLDDDIEKSKEEKIKLEENITSQTKSTEDSTNSFSDYVKSEGTKLEKTLNGIETSVKNFKKGTTDFLENSKTSLTENMQTVTGISELVIKRLYLTLIFFSAIFFASYFYLNGIKIDLGVVSGLVTIIAIFILIYKSSASFSKKILESTSKGNTELNELQKTAPRLEDDSLKINSPFNKADKELVAINSYFRRLLGSVRDLLPVLEKLYSGLDRRSRQDTFSKTLQNALLSYRIPLSVDTTDYLLNRFGSLDDLEINWIDEAARNLQPFIQIEPKIIKLCYFDYIGDSANLKNSWSEILTEPALLGQLTQILSTYVIEEKPREDYDGLVKLVSALDPFSLSSFEKAYYSFYFNLDRKKRHLINSMIDIRVKMEDIEPKILNFPPKDPDEEKWEQELIDYSSKLLNLDSNIISLFYYDRVGNYGKRKDTWSYIKKEKLFAQFIQMLIDNKLLEIPDNYRNNKKLGKKISQILENQSEFDFFNIRQSVYAEFKLIDNQRKSLIHALDDHGIHFSSSKTETDFNSFIPETTDYLNEISGELSSKLGLDKDFILLFYGSNYDKYLMENKFKEIKKGKTSELAGVLVDKNLVKIEKGLQKSEEINNISLILGFLPEFNLVQIQNFYQNYANLLEIAKKLVTFMKNEELIQKTDIDFKKVVDILPEPNMPDRLDSMTKILRVLLDEEKLFKDENMDAITTAILCLFLVHQEDVSARRCCQKAQQIEISSKILYHNMEKNGDENLGTKYSLKNIISDVLSNKTLRFDYLTEFQLGLGNGRPYTSKKDMMTHKLDNVQVQLQRFSEIENDLKEMEDSVKTVLNTEFDAYPGFLEYAIQSELVKAYVITTRSRGPALTQILDSQIISDAAGEVMGTINLDNFLIIGRPQKDPSLGSHTRIGIVPFGMTFEKFSEKFQTIYDRAVEKFLQRNNNYVKSDFQLNIFRFLSYPATFKRIRFHEDNPSDQQDFESDDPVRIIERLIKGRFPTQDSLKLILTFSTQESGIAAKDILKKIFDGKTLYSFMQKELTTLVSNKESIEKIMNDPQFDAKLYRSYEIKKFSELSSMIYESKKSSTDNQLIDILSDKIGAIVKERKLEANPEDIKQLSRLLFNKLIKFGKIFSN